MQQALLILSVILLISHAHTHPCASGEIFSGQNCIKCADIPHAKSDSLGQELFNSKCLCEEDYSWDQRSIRCQPKQVKEVQENEELNQMPENHAQSTKRLLQTATCNTAAGFIAYPIKYFTNSPKICLSCRLIPGSQGTAASQSACGCSKAVAFIEDSSFLTCYVYNSSPSYFDATQQKHFQCTSLPTALQSDCQNGRNQFILTRAGKVNCLTIRNAAVVSSACVCTTGYTLSWHTSRCECARGFFRDAAGNCVICPSSESTMCSTTQCRLKYINDKFECVLGSLVGILPATGACDPTLTIKRNVYSQRIIGCGCSLAAGNFLNGATCTNCANVANLGAGITVSECSACSSNKLANTTVECVYCANVANNLDGTSTINGCNCKVGFFWNLNTASCDCDYAEGLILSNGACFDCKVVANTQGAVDFPFTSCLCQPGFIWNSVSRTCNCDVASGHSFLSGTTCISCLAINGGNGKVSGSNACQCLKGFVWNAATSQCSCDSLQNHVLINGLCTSCWIVSKTNGLSSSTGCVCNIGLIWNNGACAPCLSGLGAIVQSSSCVACSSQSSSTLTDNCQTCSNAAGYAKSNNFCYECISQYGVTVSTVTSVGNCTCASTSTIWAPALGGCACREFSSSGMISTYNSTVTGANKWVCQSWTFTRTSRCGGTNLTNKYVSAYKICHLCLNDPNRAAAFNASQTDLCKCRPGYSLNLVTLPFGCVVAASNCNFKSNLYVRGANCVACSLLTGTAPSKDNCLGCSSSAGFILRVNSFRVTQCILCSTLLGGNTTGAALENACVCVTGRTWNPSLLRCL